MTLLNHRALMEVHLQQQQWFNFIQEGRWSHWHRITEKPQTWFHDVASFSSLAVLSADHRPICFYIFPLHKSLVLTALSLSIRPFLLTSAQHTSHHLFVIELVVCVCVCLSLCLTVSWLPTWPFYPPSALPGDSLSWMITKHCLELDSH